MGALTNNNRKRRDDYFKSSPLISSPIENTCLHNLKRQKISVEEQCAPAGGLSGVSRSIRSRVADYPEKKKGFTREIQGPVSNFRRRSFFSSSRESPSYGERISWAFKSTKDLAFKTLRYVPVNKETEEQNKEKDVIEIDSEEEDDEEGEKPNDPSDDSSIEELDYPFTESKLEKGEGVVGKGIRSLDSSLVTDASNVISKLDEATKIGLAVMERASEDSGIPIYKKLLEGIKRMSEDKLKSITFEIELCEKRLTRLEATRPQKAEEGIKKDVVEECFLPLTDEEKNEVSHALSNINRRKILVQHENSNIDITGQILQCLRPGAWLNDEVINVYLELLKEREKRDPKKFLKCHFFNTFFYKKLISGKGGYNFQSVRRWTTQRKLGYALIDCDKIFVPIHKEVHWCLAIINKKDKKFQYLDSLKGGDGQVLNVLEKYFLDEVKDKCGKEIDVSSWDKELVEDLPVQENGFDCGVFMIKYADFYSRDIGLCFRQEHMPYFRQRTAKEMLRLKAD